MMNGNFYWGCVDEQRVVHEHHVNPSTSIMDVAPTLKQLNLRIERGEFVSIVGDVGVGKSSLLQALIGEMIYDVDSPPPLIMLKGSIAYVS
jgi:ABC-type phosphate/phosphonate transport system ATPase subunit